MTSTCAAKLNLTNNCRRGYIKSTYTCYECYCTDIVPHKPMTACVCSVGRGVFARGCTWCVYGTDVHACHYVLRTNSLFLFGTVPFVALLCKCSLMNSDLSKVKYEAFGRSDCSLEDNWVRLWRDDISQSCITQLHLTHTCSTHTCYNSGHSTRNLGPHNMYT